MRATFTVSGDQDETENPAYIQVGRFNLPYGVLTDEHAHSSLAQRTGIFDYEFGTSFQKI